MTTAQCTYLSYDIRGIQRFIFAVPNLQCIVGASSQIAEFDRWVAERFDNQTIYAGGGNGMLELDEGSIAGVRDLLVTQAHQIGVDLRIGTGMTFSEAKTNDRLHPFVPSSFDGYPCSMSGLLPVNPADASTGWKLDSTVHRLIGQRREHSRHDALNKELLTPIVKELQRLGLDLSGYELQFFRNVNIRSTDKNRQQGWDELGLEKAVAGSAALGNRNRWAVIAMDGNDAGQQHQKAQSLVDNQQWDEEKRRLWVRCMSRELSQATRQAFIEAVALVIFNWLDGKPPHETSLFVLHQGEMPKLVLPVRPLVIGGDDVILLCHTEQAMAFVKHMSDRFTTLTSEAGKKWQEQNQSELWPASGNRLTISAGVLYVKNSYPLHAAIGYAESLLGSAKGRFRQDAGAGQPMPAAVDFDIVTDSLLDTPAERRRRELEFHDEDIQQIVRLTQRPYRLKAHADDPGLEEIEKLLNGPLSEGSLPSSTAAAFLSQMTQPWAGRVAFLASYSRKYPKLFRAFCEEELAKPGSGWKLVSSSNETTVRQTGLIDALILREESRRDSQVTTGVQDIRRDKTE